MFETNSSLLSTFHFSYRFVEKPHGSKDADGLTKAAEVVQRDVFDGKRWLQIRRSGVFSFLGRRIY